MSLISAPVGEIERAIVPPPEKLFGKDRIRVLVVGLDYDYNHLDQQMSQASRSDVIMALSLDFKEQRLHVLSIPRDMVATMPDGRKAKINQAQSEGGIKEAKTVIAKWLGIPSFDRYVVLRIDAAKDLINAIGGVDVNVQNSDALKHTGKNGPMDYDDNWGHLHVHLKPGLQHLDGEHAVGYARFRHDWCSDPCRIMRQQQIVRAVVKKVAHDKRNTLTRTEQLISVIRKDIETDFTSQEQLSSALAFSQLKMRDIHTAQVPYTGSVMLPDYGDSIVPDEAAKRELVAETFGQLSGRIADRKAAPPTSDVHLTIRNGTPIRGLAARTAASLRRQGFSVSEIGDAETDDVATTQIRSDPESAAISALVRKALGAPRAIVRLSPDAADPSEVTVVLGRDVLGTRR